MLMKINRKHFWCVFFFFPGRIFLCIPQAGLAFFALSVRRSGFHSNLVTSPKHTSVKLKGHFLAENINCSFGRTIHTLFCLGPITKAVTGLLRTRSAHLGTLPVMPSMHSSTPADPHSWGRAGIYPLLSTRHRAWCRAAAALPEDAAPGRPQPTSVDPNSRNYFNKICFPKTKPFFRAPRQKKQPRWLTLPLPLWGAWSRLSGFAKYPAISGLDLGCQESTQCYGWVINPLKAVFEFVMEMLTDPQL